jgi:hypothetical protein
MTKLQQVNNIVIKMLNKHKKLEEGIEKRQDLWKYNRKSNMDAIEYLGVLHNISENNKLL